MLHGALFHWLFLGAFFHWLFHGAFFSALYKPFVHGLPNLAAFTFPTCSTANAALLYLQRANNSKGSWLRTFLTLYSLATTFLAFILTLSTLIRVLVKRELCFGSKTKKGRVNLAEYEGIVYRPPKRKRSMTVNVASLYRLPMQSNSRQLTESESSYFMVENEWYMYMRCTI